MKKCVEILVLLILASGSLSSQIRFRTIVPQRAISIGESFQVQYVIENGEDIAHFSPPSFAGFRMVTGPHTYFDKKNHGHQNLVFTLAALRAGDFKIAGANCLINGKPFTSNDSFVRVIAQKAPDDSSYFLKTGEDPYVKIKEGLFIKLTLNKQTCYVGEPLVATFKLYSRVQSRSNVVKNPGFYGFSVYDMIGVNDQVQTQAQVDGHTYDVHTLRKVQLYPLQAGKFTIDAMELSNEVEFSPNDDAKPSDQSVTEQMINERDDKGGPKKNVYAVNISSIPVIVNVKPLPGKNTADTFAGAVGNFSITAHLANKSIMKNEEDSLLVDIVGDGNLTRVSAPAIKWPEGFEIFEPEVKDTFDKMQVPLAGRRQYKFGFVSNKAGTFKLPQIEFVFFNVGTQSYKTVVTDPLTLSVSEKSKKEVFLADRGIAQPLHRKSYWWIAAAVGGVATAVLLFLSAKAKQNRTQRQKELEVLAAAQPVTIGLAEIMEPARNAVNGSNAHFYAQLNRSIWSYFDLKFHHPHSQKTKREIANSLAGKAIPAELINGLLEIIHQCETGTYTTAAMEMDKQGMLSQVDKILAQIELLMA